MLGIDRDRLADGLLPGHQLVPPYVTVRTHLDVIAAAPQHQAFVNRGSLLERLIDVVLELDDLARGAIRRRR